MLDVPLAWWWGIALPWGTTGIRAALFAGVSVQALWVALRTRSGSWQQVALQRTAMWRAHLKHLPEQAQRDVLEGVRSPAMASPGTREIVSDQEVRYERDGALIARWSPHPLSHSTPAAPKAAPAAPKAAPAA